MIDKDMNANCMQAGSVRPIYGMMEPRSPHTAWQLGPTRPEKQLEEDKNDSGVASPGSDSSQDLQQSPRIQPGIPGRFSQLAMYGLNPYHNPLTPPNSEPLVSPKSEKDEDNTLTPCSSPNEVKSDDHIRRLEMTLEKNLLLSSCKSNESMDDSSNKSDNDEYDESLKVPRVNSHGKIKIFKCKQCDFVANTKIDQWAHSRTHIREDKILTCPKCPFVTEYKHHLEYHLRNHAGSKPFQCNKCDYSCVNKSMLNSHQKSHSSVYRFSCRDCNYATKYCHSLKLHLRRYQHSPGVVLDEDGKPCPDVIIDVYGTRRGPKVKSLQKNEERPKSEMPPYNLMMTPNQVPFPPYPFLGGLPQVQLLQRLFQERQALAASEPDPSKVLDLSKPGSSNEPQKNRRKGPAFKIDQSMVNESEDEDDEEMSTTMFSNVEAVVKEEKPEVEPVEAEVVPDSNNNKEKKICQYCDISFGNEVMYTIHMGYHGYNNPFTCNMCGTYCIDNVTFFLHLARVAHS